MKAYEYKTIDCTFPAGEVQFQSIKKTLPPGNCIAIAAFYNGDAPADRFINLALWDGGTEIQEECHIESWRKSTSGTYLAGFRPFSFKCDREVQFKGSSDLPLDQDFKFQMMLIVEKA